MSKVYSSTCARGEVPQMSGYADSPTEFVGDNQKKASIRQQICNRNNGNCPEGCLLSELARGSAKGVKEGY